MTISHGAGDNGWSHLSARTDAKSHTAPERLPGVAASSPSKWRVLLLNTKDSNPNYYIALSIEQALREHPAVEAVFNADYHDAIATALKQSCNLLVAVDGEGLDRGLCQRLAVLCGKSALWVSEDPYDREHNLRSANLFDCVFTNDSASVSHYDGGAQHLPFAANPRFHELAVPHDAEEARHYLYDVLFIGTAWPNRVEFIRKLSQELPGLKFKVALPTNSFLPPVNLDLPVSAYSWRSANSEVARFANRSRIVLTLHREFAVGGNPAVAATPGPRLFETALAGGFQLVDGSLPETKSYYRDSEEIACFSNIDECVAKVRYYLQNPHERLAMARAAQQRTRREHLYAHRVAKLLTTVDSVAASKPQPAKATSAKRRPNRLLFVCHNHISLGNFGGVEVYVDLLARNLPADMEPLIYFPDRTFPESRLLRLLDVRKGTTRDIRCATPHTVATLTNAEREQEFAKLLHDERIDLVHFHHMLGHPWSLPMVARTMGVPTITTVEDYYASCTHLNLINPMRRFCRASELPAEACDLCLQETMMHRYHGGGALSRDASAAAMEEQRRVGPGSQASRRGYITAALDAHDLIIFISRAAQETTLGLLPLSQRPGQMLVEGLPISNAPKPQARSDFAPPLRVAVPGNLSVIKGGDSLCRIFAATRGEPIEFHVFGRIDMPYDDILRTLNLPHVHIHGGYKPEDSCNQLATCDVALMLSIWPETYVLTVSEAWRAGVVPIVTDTGALGERVTNNVNGFKVPVDEPSAVVHKLRELLDDPRQLASARRNIHDGLYRLLDDHLELIVGHYRRLMKQYRVDERAPDYFREPPQPRCAGGGRAFHLSPDWHLPNSLAGPGPTFDQLQSLGPPSLMRRARRYLRDHGARATMRRAVRELFLRQGIRLP
jgi:glycosyltransferase involved in cell wall biosynthesis